MRKLSAAETIQPGSITKIVLKMIISAATIALNVNISTQRQNNWKPAFICPNNFISVKIKKNFELQSKIKKH